MGTKLGSVYFDVKGNKGDLGDEREYDLYLCSSSSVSALFTSPEHPKALIRQKPALLFYDSPDSSLVWLLYDHIATENDR